MYYHFYHLLIFTIGLQIRKIFEDLSPVCGQTNRKMKTEAAHSSQKSVTVYLLAERHSFSTPI